MLGGARMHAVPYKSAEAEDVDIFELLAQWEPTDSNAGPSSRHTFGPEPSQMVTLESVISPGQDAAPLTPVPGTFFPPHRALPLSAFQQNSDWVPGHAEYPMPSPRPYLKHRHVGEMPQTHPSASPTAQQQPIYPLPQHSFQSGVIAEGSLISMSPSLDAEDSTATMSSPSRKRGAGRRHKSEAWRQKNRQAQKKFRQRKKENWQAQEEELSRLSDEVNLLQQRRQQLQEALLAAQQSAPDKAATGNLVLSLEMARVALKATELGKIQVGGIAELWKGMTQKMGLYLPEARRHPSGDMARRVQVLEREAMQLLWALADHNPQALTAFEGSNLELGSQDDHRGSPWESVLGQLQLAPQQGHTLRAVHDMLSSNLEQLLAERRALVGRLKGLPANRNEVQLAVGKQLLQQIEANVHAAYICKTYYVSHAWMKILQPLQRVHLVVLAYPYGPDMLSLMSLSARTGGIHESLEHAAALQVPDLADKKSLGNPAPVKRVAAERAASTGGTQQAAEAEDSAEWGIRSLRLPDQADWRAALTQPLSLLRKES